MQHQTTQGSTGSGAQPQGDPKTTQSPSQPPPQAIDISAASIASGPTTQKHSTGTSSPVRAYHTEFSGIEPGVGIVTGILTAASAYATATMTTGQVGFLAGGLITTAVAYLGIKVIEAGAEKRLRDQCDLRLKGAIQSADINHTVKALKETVDLLTSLKKGMFSGLFRSRGEDHLVMSPWAQTELTNVDKLIGKAEVLKVRAESLVKQEDLLAEEARARADREEKAKMSPAPKKEQLSEVALELRQAVCDRWLLKKIEEYELGHGGTRPTSKVQAQWIKAAKNLFTDVPESELKSILRTAMAEPHLRSIPELAAANVASLSPDAQEKYLSRQFQSYETDQATGQKSREKEVLSRSKDTDTKETAAATARSALLRDVDQFVESGIANQFIWRKNFLYISAARAVVAGGALFAILNWPTF